MPRPPGPPFIASVRSQRLEVDAGSPTVALALQPRLSELNRRRLLPVIERVLREAGDPGRQVRIERLRVDLGEVPLGALESELPRLLERELRRAVAAALRGDDAEARVRARPLAQARAELLERHLLRGTLPFWAPPGTSLRSLVDDMARADPGLLADTVRRLGRNPLVLERLAAQLGDAALARLVRVLEPEHAALVLAYVLDLRRVHRRAPLLPLSERRFGRVLWMLVQAYLVRDPGSEFNRRAFVRSLLRGMARGQGLDYAALLATLGRGLERTRRHRAIRSSLPSVVGDLLREAGLAPGASARAASHPQRADDPDAVEERAEPDPVDDCGADRDARDPALADEFDALWADAGDPDPADDVDRLRPDAVDSDSVDDLHSLRPGAGDPDSLDAVDPLRTGAGDPESAHDVDRPRASAGDSHSVDAADTARADAADADSVDTLDRLRVRAGDADPVDAADPLRPGAGSPDSVDDADPLRDDAGNADSVDAVDGRRADAIDPASADAVGAELAGGAVDSAGSRRAAGEASASTDAARTSRRRGAGDAGPPELARYEAADALAYLLRNGVLPWTALLRDPPPDEARLLAALPDLPLSLLRRVLRARSADERRRMTAALARGLGEDELARLLLRVLPALETGPFREALSAFTDAAADRRAFLARVLGAALAGEALDLEALAAGAGGTDPARPADLTAWPAHLLRSVLTDALRAGPARERAHPTPAALLDALAAAHPADARYYLRALSRRPELAAALARSVPTPVHGRLLDRLYPAAAPMARALHAALAALPAPRRAADDQVRQVVLLEMMGSAEGEAAGTAFFTRVLRRLFGPRLPDPVGEHLLAAADAWARPGALPAAHAAAFRAAVRAALAESPGDGAAPADAAAAPRRASEAPPVPRDAVLAFLLGRGPRAPFPADAGRGAAERGPSTVSTLSPDALRHALERMLDEAPGEIIPLLRRHSADRRVRERWVRVLPEPALARLAHLLEPHRHDTLLRTAEMLDAAWHEAAPAGFPAPHGRRRFWGFLLRFLARNAGADRLTDRLVAAFFADRAARCRRLSPVPDLPAIGARLLEAAGRVAGTRGHARLHAALHRQRRRLLARWAPDSAEAAHASAAAGESGPSRPPRVRAQGARPARRPPAFRLGAEDAGQDGEPVYVANAGLVLASPFLPRLFGSLDLLVDGEDGQPRFRDAEAVSRGVHLLQYLVDGGTSTPEPALALNKVLCGVPLDTPVDASIRMTDAETATCSQLLAAMLANWTAIHGTSVEGMRETFLRREGRLAAADERWKLTVQRKTLDVLVDQVPWSISVVLHRWMPMPLHVTW